MIPRASTRRTLLGITGLGLAAGGAGARAVKAGALQDDPEPVPPDGAAPASPVEAEMLAGIQQTLDRQAAARSARDRAAFMATIDPRNLTWRRIAGEYFDTFAPSWSRSEQLAATRIALKADGYLKAYVSHPPARLAAWVFAPTDQGWLQAEPLNEELGQRKSLETVHFRFSYYGWDDDVVDNVADVAERSYDGVVQQLGAAPGFLVVASLNPTYASHSGLRGLGVQAAYLPDTKNTILLRSPESFGAGEFPADEGPYPSLAYPFTHELTHLVNDQIYRLVKMRHWMTEGLAEHVSGHYREDEVRFSFQFRASLTLDKADEVIEWNTDPSKGFTAGQISLAYGESALAVAYYFERFGQPKFWELAQAFGDSRKWSDSFQTVTGITWEQFQTDWDAWARQRLAL